MPIDGFRNRGFYVVAYHYTNISALDLTLRNCQQTEPWTFSAVLRPRKESAKRLFPICTFLWPLLVCFILLERLVAKLSVLEFLWCAP